MNSVLLPGARLRTIRRVEGEDQVLRPTSAYGVEGGRSVQDLLQKSIYIANGVLFSTAPVTTDMEYNMITDQPHFAADIFLLDIRRMLSLENPIYRRLF